MRAEETSRRKFLVSSMTGLSAAWVAANWNGMAEAASIPAGTQMTFFTPMQAQDVDAMAAQIIPTTDTPGAREAQVVYFIDNAQDIYTKGFADLAKQVKAVNPAAESFASLTSAQQIQVLTAMEKTPFFLAVRSHTIMGMFAAPQHGGNYQKVGWKLIDFDDSLNFKPPFGAYDRA
jgi:gluconate 2-dehydrogenase gamma chain